MESSACPHANRGGDSRPPSCARVRTAAPILLLGVLHACSEHGASGGKTAKLPCLERAGVDFGADNVQANRARPKVQGRPLCKQRVDPTAGRQGWRQVFGMLAAACGWAASTARRTNLGMRRSLAIRMTVAGPARATSVWTSGSTSSAKYTMSVPMMRSGRLMASGSATSTHESRHVKSAAVAVPTPLRARTPTAQTPAAERWTGV